MTHSFDLQTACPHEHQNAARHMLYQHSHTGPCMSTQTALTKGCPQQVAEQHLKQMAQQAFVLPADLHIKICLL